MVPEQAPEASWERLRIRSRFSRDLGVQNGSEMEAKISSKFVKKSIPTTTLTANSFSYRFELRFWSIFVAKMDLSWD